MFHKVYGCLRALMVVWIGASLLKAVEAPVFSFFSSDSRALANNALASRPVVSFDFASNNPFWPNNKRGSRSFNSSALAKKEWILRGTIVSASGNLAILEDKMTKQQHLVSIGGVLNNQRVVEVKRNQVVLADLHQKKNWVLSLVDTEVETSFVLALQGADALPQALVESEIPQLKENEFIIKRSFLRALVAKMPKLLSSLELILLEIERIPQGYLISVGPQLVQMAPIGLEDGDLIKKINGHVIDSEATLLAVFNEVTRQSEIKIEIDRNNELMTLTYHVQP